MAIKDLFGCQYVQLVLVEMQMLDEAYNPMNYSKWSVAHVFVKKIFNNLCSMYD